ncbi:uncharacterized protein BP01DRAFT_418404 [Aspergillus saccharolyticus JOP 1030-1]|uniref:Uncharacterized protein n=1 Tax=Aspergillus saccharolyticus JOP 1030-1 TaxID=1450539 RepID=A0A318ZE89_9EURO|nr:hypothetical protein BP01DRAFT_418404 [Aspergillus saccharolyticus JOP 1030-1]PYH41880.1 hypothetical protein BP01DRAFT_418404 [Aspergillus saccharolyticus JOP 1030-1]
MPRPPTKRSRFTSETSKTKNHHATDTVGSTKQSSEDSSHNYPNLLHMTERPDFAYVPHQNDQTPVVKTHDYAIDSSPLEECGPTSGRPVTRARGYSSTLSIIGRKGDGSSKIPGTPAYESSVLSNFRRRPRQPSILHIMQADDSSSDLDDEDFLGGLSPEDESTPLDISRVRSLIPAHVTTSSSPGPSSPSSNKQRKRKSPAEEIEIEYASDSQAVRHSPCTSITVQESNQPGCTMQHLMSPGAMSETMAPPMSSSPAASPVLTPSITSAEMSLAVPKITLGILSEQRNNVSKNVPTLALQDRLLPRRTKAQRKCLASTLSDSSCSESEQDEDELSYAPPGKSCQASRTHIRRPKSQKPRNKLQEERTKTATIESRKRNGCESHKCKSRTRVGADPLLCARSNAPEEPPLPSSSPLSSPLGSNAYCSGVPSGFEKLLKDRYLSEELRLQAKKFADVDKWVLDYEDVNPYVSQGSDAFR